MDLEKERLQEVLKEVQRESDDKEETEEEDGENESSSEEDSSDHEAENEREEPWAEWTPTVEECSSEEEMDETELDQAQKQELWTGRNGRLWLPHHEKTLRFFPGNIPPPGPTRYAVARLTEEPRSSWDLLFAPDLVHHICKMTNMHGRRTKPEWHDVSDTEMEAYIGLLLLSGVFRSNNEGMRLLWDRSFGREIFRTTMPRTRFEEISANLRFDDRLTRPQRQRRDKLAAVREMWDLWQNRLGLPFNCGQEVGIITATISG